MADYGGYISRRDFLKHTALGGLAAASMTAGIAPLEAQDTPELPRRKLGETGLEVSVIGYGAEFMSDEGLVEHLINGGVNHVDTAAMYQSGNSERNLAPVLQKHGESLTVATKFHRAIPVDAPKEQFIECFNGSCERMGVEGVDIIYIHDRRTPEAVNCLGAKQAFDELKEAGRVKYFGMSTHLRQVSCIEAALELGWFDVLLVAHNFMSPASDAEVLKQAVEAGVGVMVMKVCKALSGGRDWYPRATEEQKAVLDEVNLFQAAIKWVLKREYVSAAIVCMSNYDEANEDLAAAREVLTETEARALDLYKTLADAAVCRGCGRCDEVCPQGLAVSDILRYKLYCEGYGQRENASRLYRSLPISATFAGCNGCGTCEDTCPHGLPIREELRQAYELLA